MYMHFVHVFGITLWRRKKNSHSADLLRVFLYALLRITLKLKWLFKNTLPMIVFCWNTINQLLNLQLLLSLSYASFWIFSPQQCSLLWTMSHYRVKKTIEIPLFIENILKSGWLLQKKPVIYAIMKRGNLGLNSLKELHAKK